MAHVLKVLVHQVLELGLVPGTLDLGRNEGTKLCCLVSQGGKLLLSRAMGDFGSGV